MNRKEEVRVKDVTTLLDLRINTDIKGMPGGQIKLVQGNTSGHIDYALFVDDKYLGGFDAANAQQAVLIGLGKMRELMALLSESGEGV